MRNEPKESVILVVCTVLSVVITASLGIAYKNLKEDYVIAVAQKVVLEEELDQRFDELLACESKLPVTEAVVDPE